MGWLKIEHSTSNRNEYKEKENLSEDINLLINEYLNGDDQVINTLKTLYQNNDINNKRLIRSMIQDAKNDPGMNNQDKVRLINLNATLQNLESQIPKPFEISTNRSESFFNLNPKFQAKGMYYLVNYEMNMISPNTWELNMTLENHKTVLTQSINLNYHVRIENGNINFYNENNGLVASSNIPNQHNGQGRHSNNRFTQGGAKIIPFGPQSQLTINLNNFR